MYNIFPNKTVSILIVLLVLLNIFSWSAYVSRGTEISKLSRNPDGAAQARHILSFQKLFIEKVLSSDGVVSYESRKELEQSVGRSDNDAVIKAWNSFLSAKTESDGQEAVRNLLETMSIEALKSF